MFADVIIDISHEKLDKTFQYKIPEQLEKYIHPGVRVLVPFGNAAEKSAFVLELSTEPKIEEWKIKEISGLDKGAGTTEEKLIGLAHWIKVNCGCTMNQALKCVLPAKKEVRAVVNRTVRLKVSKEELTAYTERLRSNKNAAARLRLLEELRDKPMLPFSIITGKLSVTSSTVNSLAKAGIVEVIEEKNYRNPVNFENAGSYNIVLNAAQQQVCDSIWNSRNEKNVHLLRGVTGSGKTEVYIELIKRTISEGRQAIVLIPEIALTYQTLMRFFRCFGDRVTYIHSRQSAGERFDQLKRAKNGDVDIMIGPRSALFTPFNNLGLIIIDEEHEGAYKSESVPKYHARDVAIARAGMEGATVLLGSATPCVETYYRAKEGMYGLHLLNQRAGAGSMASVEVVDLREELNKGNRSIISDRLDELIKERLNKKEQIMLFINRRGFSSFVSCRKCGYVVKCPNCDVSLKLHKVYVPGRYGEQETHLRCHYCGYKQENITLCPKCESKYIAAFGIGTQKIEEMIKEKYPEAGVLRMDLDTTSGKEGHARILQSFANHEADILIGTQMIVKGHDFSNVTLVGILAADLSMYGSDFRSNERTFDLICQAAGRAGRGEKRGNVVIQTYNPDEYAITTSAAQDYEEFYEHEMAYRKLLKHPPFSNMMVILITSADEKIASGEAAFAAEIIRRENIEMLEVIGPGPASVAKVENIYRQVIYVKSKESIGLIKAKDAVERLYEKRKAMVNISFDLSPQNMY